MTALQSESMLLRTGQIDAFDDLLAELARGLDVREIFQLLARVNVSAVSG